MLQNTLWSKWSLHPFQTLAQQVHVPNGHSSSNNKMVLNNSNSTIFIFTSSNTIQQVHPVEPQYVFLFFPRFSQKGRVMN